MFGSMTSSHRRGGQPRTTTPLWQVTMDGNDDLHGSNEESRSSDYGEPGRAGEVGLREHLSIMGNRLLHSRAYNLLYALLIVLNTVALVVAITAPESGASPLMAYLDVVITGSLLVEVALRMLVQGRLRFWSEGANRFDCFVCALCAMTLLLTLVDGPSGTAGRLEQVFTIIVVVVRYVIQLARLAVFVRSYKRTSSGSTADIVLGFDADDAEDARLCSVHGSGREAANGGTHVSESMAHHAFIELEAGGAGAGEAVYSNKGRTSASISGMPDSPWQ